jgi:hypothetical protein
MPQQCFATLLGGIKGRDSPAMAKLKLEAII